MPGCTAANCRKKTFCLCYLTAAACLFVAMNKLHNDWCPCAVRTLHRQASREVPCFARQCSLQPQTNLKTCVIHETGNINIVQPHLCSTQCYGYGIEQHFNLQPAEHHNCQTSHQRVQWVNRCTVLHVLLLLLLRLHQLLLLQGTILQCPCAAGGLFSTHT